MEPSIDKISLNEEDIYDQLLNFLNASWSLIKLSNCTNEIENVLPLETSIVIDNINNCLSSKKSKVLNYSFQNIDEASNYTNNNN